MMRRLVVACCLTGCTAWKPPPQDPADCEYGAVDVIAHRVAIEASFAPRSLRGHGTITISARRPLRCIMLDANLARIEEVTVDKRRVEFAHRNGQLCIQLPHEIASGARLDLDTTWEARVDAPTPRYFEDQVWGGYSTSMWMPTLLDSSQRAILNLEVTAPPGFVAVASGKQVSSRPSKAGGTVSTFEIDEPTQPFLYAFAIGRFAEVSRSVDGKTVRVLGPTNTDLNQVLEVTVDALRTLRALTGRDLPTRAYTSVLVHGDAAQEAKGFALIGDKLVTSLREDPSDDWLISHELAHQWFGVMLSCLDFNDFWLNEGFATFMVAAIKEAKWGRAAYDREVALWRKRSARVSAAGRDAPVSLAVPRAPRRGVRDEELQARGVTYSRGALVLDHLRTELGDVLFWKAVQEYVKTAKKPVTSEDLRTAFEVVSQRDLKPFFDRWVYAAAPDL
jgi:aminopeptidase N